MLTETDASVFRDVDTPSPSIKTTSTQTNHLIKEETEDYLARPDSGTSIPKFVERDYYSVDSKFEYPRDGNDPGLVLIFNQEIVPNYKPRRGSRRDINEIVVCLQRQGFNIDKNNILNDATSETILAKLDEVSQRDLSQTNCLIVFFSTHGEELEKLETNNGSLHTWQIWEKFIHCKGLQNKPKMFIFQACKGLSYTTTNVASSISQIAPYNIFSMKHVGPDMLLAYSTIEGNLSFRHRITGSWFIQELCKNITAYGKRDDVVSLIIRTTKCVCGNYFQYDEEEVRKQMPVFVSTLSKKFYLNRNKDRHLLIRVLKSNEEILQTMKNLRERIDKLLQRESS